MRIREPVVAGQFYSAERERCRADLDRLLHQAGEPAEPLDRLVGGLVPHAGWVYSGSVTAKVFRALSAARTPTIVILFGGVHRYRGREAALFGSGRWETPIGPVGIDERLAERILGHTNVIVDDPYAHEEEHSIEVQMPFVRRLFPEAAIVPIMVPSVATAHEVGDAVGRTLKAYRYDAIVVGTTDLTHYGPRYGFTPQGVGAKANAWAKVENDRRFIDLVLDLRTKDVVDEADRHKNACSSGAVAATLAACLALGATRSVLMEHKTSADVLRELRAEDSTDSVGYAGIVFAS